MKAGIVSLVDDDVNVRGLCDQDSCDSDSCDSCEGSGPCDSCDSGGDCVCDAGDGTWT